VARKGLLASVTAGDTSSAANEARSEYTRRGASRSMMISIEEMAENSKRMIAGEVVVTLDPDLIDSSFVSDRLGDDDGEGDYRSLLEAIKENGQSTPILVRPHPSTHGRYMVVFGHRRRRVAEELGIPVRAVVKNIEDIGHIIAQGQENTARANLSFIEKALFAKKLLDMGQTKNTIKSALTIDDTLLSRMLAVGQNVPTEVIEAIGSAKSVGRDRWEEFKKLVAVSANADLAKSLVRSNEFHAQPTADRFNFLLGRLKARRKAAREAGGQKVVEASWIAKDKMVAASYRNTGKTFSLSLKSENAGEFGRYISSNLEALYQAFETANASNETGD
jgi:ParB family chromosome partitioning protein